jgi:hypothetical protein
MNLDKGSNSANSNQPALQVTTNPMFLQAGIPQPTQFSSAITAGGRFGAGGSSSISGGGSGGYSGASGGGSGRYSSASGGGGSGRYSSASGGGGAFGNSSVSGGGASGGGGFGSSSMSGGGASGGGFGGYSGASGGGASGGGFGSSGASGGGASGGGFGSSSASSGGASGGFFSGCVFYGRSVLKQDGNLTPTEQEFQAQLKSSYRSGNDNFSILQQYTKLTEEEHNYVLCIIEMYLNAELNGLANFSSGQRGGASTTPSKSWQVEEASSMLDDLLDRDEWLDFAEWFLNQKGDTKSRKSSQATFQTCKYDPRDSIRETFLLNVFTPTVPKQKGKQNSVRVVPGAIFETHPTQHVKVIGAHIAQLKGISTFILYLQQKANRMYSDDPDKLQSIHECIKKLDKFATVLPALGAYNDDHENLMREFNISTYFALYSILVSIIGLDCLKSLCELMHHKEKSIVEAVARGDQFIKTKHDTENEKLQKLYRDKVTEFCGNKYDVDEVLSYVMGVSEREPSVLSSLQMRQLNQIKKKYEDEKKQLENSYAIWRQIESEEHPCASIFREVGLAGGILEYVDLNKSNAVAYLSKNAPNGKGKSALIHSALLCEDVTNVCDLADKVSRWVNAVYGLPEADSKQLVKLAESLLLQLGGRKERVNLFTLAHQAAIMLLSRGYPLTSLWLTTDINHDKILKTTAGTGGAVRSDQLPFFYRETSRVALKELETIEPTIERQIDKVAIKEADDLVEMVARLQSGRVDSEGEPAGGGYKKVYASIQKEVAANPAYSRAVAAAHASRSSLNYGSNTEVVNGQLYLNSSAGIIDEPSEELSILMASSFGNNGRFNPIELSTRFQTMIHNGIVKSIGGEGYVYDDILFPSLPQTDQPVIVDYNVSIFYSDIAMLNTFSRQKIGFRIKPTTEIIKKYLDQRYGNQRTAADKIVICRMLKEHVSIQYDGANVDAIVEAYHQEDENRPLGLYPAVASRSSALLASSDMGQGAGNVLDGPPPNRPELKRAKSETGKFTIP